MIRSWSLYPNATRACLLGLGERHLYGLRALKSGEAAVLAAVAEDVFDDPIDPALAHAFLADPRHHLVVAIDDNVVVGFVSAVDYLHPDKPVELWINEVGVAATHHRRGIAQAMLSAMFDLGRSIGCAHAWVLTDDANDAANRLYRSLGGQEGPDDTNPTARTIGYSFAL